MAEAFARRRSAGGAPTIGAVTPSPSSASATSLVRDRQRSSSSRSPGSSGFVADPGRERPSTPSTAPSCSSRRSASTPIPDTAGAKAFSLVIVVAGVALLLYVIGVVIELTSSGVVSGAWQDERRTGVAWSRLERALPDLRLRPGRPARRRTSSARAGVPLRRHRCESGGRGARHASAATRDRGERDRRRRARAGRDRAAPAASSPASTRTPRTCTSSSSARELRPDLLIVARASSEDAGDEAPPRRRRPGRHAVRDRRPGAGDARPAAAGLRVPRGRHRRR